MSLSCWLERASRTSEAFLHDLRYAARTFTSAPAFTLTAIATMALGIGAATAVFAVVDAVLLRPLPYRDADRVAIVWAVPPEGTRTWLSLPELADLRERVPAFAATAGLSDLKLTLTGAGDPEELEVVAASANLLEVTGVVPALGSWFIGEHDVANAPAVTVLSDSLWRRRFGARTDVIGTAVTLDGRSHLVIGVMPRTFVIPPPSSVFPSEVDAWVPLESHVTVRGRDMRMLHVLGRLSAGASIEEARAQAGAAARTVSASHPEYRGRTWTFDVVSLQADLARTVRPVLLIIFAIVGLVLVIAAANVSALQLSRSAGRQQEIAVRTSLGATPARLVGQLLTEALLLGAVGAVAGVVLARLLVGFARVSPLAVLPRFADVTIDWRVTLFAILMSLASALIVGLAPLSSTRSVAQDALRVRDHSYSAIRAGRVFAAAQIALACTVLVVALLLARGFVSLLATDVGFTTESLLTFRVSLPPKYAEAPQITSFFDRVLEKLRTTPGVIGASAVTQLPLSGASLGSSFLLDRAADPSSRVDADYRGVTSDYFSTMGIAMVAGRSFSAGDAATSPQVAIVDEQFARRAWPNESAIGKRIRWFRAPDRELEVVGLVRAVRHRGFDAPARETVYRPHTQYARSTMFVVVKTSGDPLRHAAVAREAVRSIDRDQPIADVAPLETLASRALAQPGLGAVLSSAFAAVALVLTMVGTYGLLAFTVSRRKREVGVRLALGASPRQIVRLVMNDGLKLAAFGLLAGVPAALLAGRAAEKMLALPVHVDAVTMLTAIGVLVASTALACWTPSRRASRVSPAESLRN